jgi:DeoR/GlpR family transcriptional regulator of sugar metabolism
VLVSRRRSRIIEEARRRGAASISLLADELGVSPMTIRRDIEALAAEGLVDKVRGGVALPRATGSGAQAFDSRKGRMPLEKRAIARRAARLVKPGMAVALSSGTTIWALAQELRSVPELTIVTNSLPVADLFARPARADEPYTQTVVLTGGVRTPSEALVGPVAVRTLEHLHCDIAFLGVHGMDISAGFTATNLLEAETDRALVAAGGEAVVLADSAKWGIVGLTTILDLNDVDRLVTDDGLPPEARAELDARVRELWVVPVGTEIVVDDVDIDEFAPTRARR